MINFVWKFKGSSFSLAITILSTLSLIAPFYFWGNELGIIAYPLITFSIALFVFVSLNLSENPYRHKPVSHKKAKILDIGIFLLLLLLTITHQFIPFFFPKGFVLITLLVLIAITLRIIFSPDLVALVQVLMLATILRFSIWYSAPILGKDSRLHLAIVGYINSSGGLIPDAISYYHWYPSAHLFASSVSLITNSPPKIAFFISIALISILSIGVIYLFTLRIIPVGNNVPALFAALIVTLASGHLSLSGTPIAQTFSFSLIPFILLLLIKPLGGRRIVLISILLVAIVFTHVLTPIILIITIGMWYISEKTINNISGHHYSTRLSDLRITTLSIILIMALEYWIYMGFLNLQIGRFLRILSTRYTLQGKVSSPGGGAMADVSLFLDFDPLLRFAGSLLVQGFFITIAGAFILKWLFNKKLNREYSGWILASCVVFAIFAFSIFLEGGHNTTRAMAAISLIVSPVAGFSIHKIIPGLGKPGIALVVMILLFGGFIGLTSPSVLVNERTSGLKPSLSHSELGAVQFVNHHGIDSYSDSYTSASGAMEMLGSGKPETYYISMYADSIEVSNDLFKNYKKGEPYLYRTYFKDFSDLDVPHRFEIFYSSGEAKLIGSGRPD